MKTVGLLLLLAVAAEGAAPRIPPMAMRGIRLYYDFDTQGPVATNAVSTNAAGAVSGPRWEPAGKYGGAYDFDGFDNVVRIGWSEKSDIRDSFTVAAWVKPARDYPLPEVAATGVTASKCGFIFAPRHGGRENAGVGVSVGVNGIVIAEHGEGYLPAVLVCKRSLGKVWHHVAVVVENKKSTLFVDGVPIRSSLKSTRQHLLCPDVIGCGGLGDKSAYEGLIDEVAIWDRALTPSEVRSLFK